MSSKSKYLHGQSMVRTEQYIDDINTTMKIETD